MPVLANPKHERFAQERALGKSSDEAYVQAGYKAHRSNAARMSTNEHILSRIEEIVSKAAEKVGITLERIISEMATLGLANIADYVDTSGASPVISLQGVSREKLAALSEITTETVFERSGKGAPTEVRRVKIKLWDKRASLVDLWQHLGWSKRRVEHTGKDGTPLPAAAVTIFQLPDNGRS